MEVELIPLKVTFSPNKLVIQYIKEISFLASKENINHKHVINEQIYLKVVHWILNEEEL